MARSTLARRSFLEKGGAVASGVAIAGCSGRSNPQSETTERPETETQTPTPTETETDMRSDRTKVTEKESEQRELGHLHGITGRTWPPDISGHHQRRFEWSAFGGEWWIEIGISKALGEYYDARFGRSRDYGMYVSDPYGTEHLEFLVNQFEQLGKDQDLSDRQVIDLATAFVQQLQYTPDDISTGFDQYTYYPIETLIERGGDCEDSVILLAAILQEMGYGCVLLHLKGAEHMALGVAGDPSIPGTYYEYRGKRYYYVETTGQGWQIGELPRGYENERAEIVEIDHYPTLVYAWETEMEGNGTIDVNVEVANVGRVPASQIALLAAFEDESERTRTQEEEMIGSLQPDNTTHATLKLQPPDGEKLRLTTGLAIDGTIHDIDRSEWRRPV